LDKSAVKVICYVSRKCVVTQELKQRLELDFKEIPLLLLRVEKLPRDALIELEVFGHKNARSDSILKSDSISVCSNYKY
jgi:hypothetical protein